MVFLTVSSGIGGGIVLGGRLLRGARGIAGSLGQSPRAGRDGYVRLETLASGFGIAAAAKAAGRDADARAVFAAARAGAPWAEGILVEAAGELAAAVAGLQAVVDPECIVIGGGVGLAEGFLDAHRGRAAAPTRRSSFRRSPAPSSASMPASSAPRAWSSCPRPEPTSRGGGRA